MITRFRLEAEAKTRPEVKGSLDEAARRIIVEENTVHNDWTVTQETSTWIADTDSYVGRIVMKRKTV